MAISSYDNVTRHDISHFRHHLVADTLLQNRNILLLCERAYITMQRGCGNSGGRDDMVEHNMRPFGVEHMPTRLRRQFSKRLDSQWRCRIVAHHTINLHHHGLPLLYGTTQLVTKDLLS